MAAVRDKGRQMAMTVSHVEGGVPGAAQPPVSVVSLVFGGGGAFGIAWHLAVIAALRDAGFDLDDAPAIGTSAGSWACAALRLDLDFESFAQIDDIEVPDRRHGLLATIARDLVGEARCPNVRISTVELPRLRRRLHDGAEYPVADLIAASSAVPGLFAPHSIDGVLHVDGGVRSMASPAHAEPATILVASLPIAGPLFGPFGRVLETTARNALARWRRATGGHTLVLRPGRRLSALVGLRPHALFDQELARRVYPLAYEQVSDRIAARRHTLPVPEVAAA